ncbi:MAG: L-seryl-tRNA(Sec) selenium transferase [Deltaproteobacteria bacterium]|nr:L-seryl-tRNA(Sec) selenium transferase [Deltaproteobacteria bacterium]
MSEGADRLRALPSVDRVLSTSIAIGLLQHVRRAYVVESVRAVLDELRDQLGSGQLEGAPIAETVANLVATRIKATEQQKLRPLVNATGVVLHTNLGRALLADEAVDAVAAVAAQASNLEYDLKSGERGDRDDLISDDLCALTGAAAATVVNNNAAAVLLALNTIGEGREVVVSRGELIEIGGSFRIPDVMTKSQCVLCEVGTTNRTHAHDYEAAIHSRTALLLKVHTSNYRIVGFTSDVSLEELVKIGHERGLPVMEDLGSGALIDLSEYGLPKEPVVAERIRCGADIVTFSGDKLLGGPQAGLIVGRHDLIERMKRNPLKRALRCDKMTLVALAATLRAYRTAPDLPRVLPTLRWLTRPLSDIHATGQRAVQLLRQALGDAFRVDLIESEAQIGSGALPIEHLPSRAVRISHPTLGANDIATHFRLSDPPIIGRIHDGCFLLDLRGVFDAQDLVPRSSAISE